ncbi:MAG: hypothetical protein SV775_15885 [Thermodesulfobacteriota bacterium]|nr:hypothetical protein [Thermodesulfobacteriota bacterium]
MAGKVGLKSKMNNALKHGESFKTKGFDKETLKGKHRFKISGRVLRADKDFSYRILMAFLEEK